MRVSFFLIAVLITDVWAAKCPENFQAFEDECFYIGEEKITWAGADEKCKALGGFLYEPRPGDSDDTKDRLLNEVEAKGAQQVWLGIFSDEDGGLSYASNYESSKIDYLNESTTTFSVNTKLAPGPIPDSNCVQYDSFREKIKYVKTSCVKQLQYVCIYKPWYPCFTCPWYYGDCCCENKIKPQCYQFNTLFLEDSLPMTMSLNDCQESCKSTSACKFFTYSTLTSRCGLRFYNPGGVITSPGQVSGTESKILSTNEVFVGRTEHITNPFKCQEACQKDAKCLSVTWNNAFSSNPETCVFNYGPTVNQVFVGPFSGLRSAPKFCNNDCLARDKTIPDFEANHQEYSNVYYL